MAFVDKALVTKIKSMHALHIDEDGYETLMKKKAIKDVALFLKEHKAYESLLKNIPISALNRSRLEGLIKKHHFDEMIRLLKFIHLKDKSFYTISIVTMEHETLLAMLRRFISTEDYDVIEQIPVYFDRYSKMDVLKVTQSKDLDSLTEALTGTRYQKIFQPFKHVFNEDIRYYEFEALLENDFYHYAFQQIKDNYHGRFKDKLIQMYTSRIEMENMIKVYRLKKFYGIENEDIKAILIPTNRAIEKKLDKIIAIEKPEDIFSEIIKNKSDENTSQDEFIYLEYYRDFLKFKMAKDFLYFTTETPAIFLGYMFISELEIANLTHIIEGIRYQVPENEIRQMLVY